MISSSFLHFFSTPSSSVDVKLHRRSFIANLLLLIGYVFGLWFQMYQLKSRDRELIAITVYFVGFALLVISGIVELSVDIFSIRTVEHGRYHSNSPLWNRVISVLFITMAILDIFAFCYWILKDFHTEDVLLLCSGYFLLVMSILVLFFQVKETIDDTPDRIDLVANGLIFFDALLNIMLRHLELSSDFDNACKRMELAVVIFFLATAVMYVSADVIRIQSSVGGIKQQQSAQTSTQETKV